MTTTLRPYLFIFAFLIFAAGVTAWYVTSPVTVKDEQEALRSLQDWIRNNPQQRKYIVRWRSADFLWGPTYIGWTYMEYNRSQRAITLTPYKFRPKYWFSRKFPFVGKRGYFLTGCDWPTPNIGRKASDALILKGDDFYETMSAAGCSFPCRLTT